MPDDHPFHRSTVTNSAQYTAAFNAWGEWARATTDNHHDWWGAIAEAIFDKLNNRRLYLIDKKHNQHILSEGEEDELACLQKAVFEFLDAVFPRADDLSRTLEEMDNKLATRHAPRLP